MYGDKFKISKQVRSQVPPEENERLGETSPPPPTSRTGLIKITDISMKKIEKKGKDDK
jgi:hypothetical protein